MFNIKWQHIITSGSCTSCESEIWKRPCVIREVDMEMTMWGGGGRRQIWQ